MRKPIQRSFRPWPENQERLESARELGFNVSELLNELLEKHLREHLSQKMEKLRQALSAPAK